MTTINPPRKKRNHLAHSSWALLREYQRRFPIVSPLDGETSYPPLDRCIERLVERAIAHEKCAAPKLLDYSGSNLTKPAVIAPIPAGESDFDPTPPANPGADPFAKDWDSAADAAYDSETGAEKAKVTEAQRPKAQSK